MTGTVARPGGTRAAPCHVAVALVRSKHLGTAAIAADAGITGATVDVAADVRRSERRRVW
jgi:hypothetical protein